jgi:DNA repair protein RadC
MQNLIIPEIQFSLSYKNQVKQSELRQITSSKECEEILRIVFDSSTFLWREEMLLLCLNRNNKVIGYYRVSVGGIAGTVCDPKVIFTIALNSGASAIVLAHNHPSGNLIPSNADKTLTKKIKDLGALLEIVLIEHMILTQESYYSFSDNGTL